MKSVVVLVALLVVATAGPAKAEVSSTNLFNREPKVLSPEVASGLRGKRVYVSTSESPEMRFEGWFGREDVARLHSVFDPDAKDEYRSLIVPGKRFHDPALDAARKIADRMVASYGVILVSDRESADIVVGVDTILWQLSRRRSPWLVYTAFIVVQDVPSQKPMVSATCTAHNHDSGNRHLDTYFANEMAIFKQEVSELGEACADAFVDQSLGGSKPRNRL